MPVRPLGPEEVRFTGSLEDVNSYFADMHWSDGLAIIPPSVEKVQAFLAFTDSAPDEEIAVLRPANVRATPVNIRGQRRRCRERPRADRSARCNRRSPRRAGVQPRAARHDDRRVPSSWSTAPIIEELGIEYATAHIYLAGRTRQSAAPSGGSLCATSPDSDQASSTSSGTYGYIPPFVIAENEATLAGNRIGIPCTFDRLRRRHEARMSSCGTTSNGARGPRDLGYRRRGDLAAHLPRDHPRGEPDALGLFPTEQMVIGR